LEKTHSISYRRKTELYRKLYWQSRSTCIFPAFGIGLEADCTPAVAKSTRRHPIASNNACPLRPQRKLAAGGFDAHALAA